MPPSIVSADVYDAIAEAVTPTPADIMTIKQVLLGRLADGNATSTHELHMAVLNHFGVPPASHREDRYDVQPDADAVDAEHTAIKRPRLDFGTKLAIAALVADGALTATGGSSGNERISVSVHRSGTSGSERFPASIPAMAGGYRVTPGREPVTVSPLLDAGLFVEGLDGLLDVRARRCLEEALGAARRGLYLSALNLIGAVSEAAWFTIGEALAPNHPVLNDPLTRNATAQLQHLVAEVLAGVRRQSITVTELRAHAAYLRDLRNYGVHPREAVDPGQEHAFTETGCLLILMETHRYLARLYAVAQEAGAGLGEEDP